MKMAITSQNKRLIALSEIEQDRKKKGQLLKESVTGESAQQKITTKEKIASIGEYVPGEVIAFWIAAIAIFDQVAGDVNIEIYAWVFIIGLCVVTFFLAWWNGVKDIVQLSFGVIAFIVWVITLGVPFSQYGWYNAAIFGIVLAFFTLSAPWSSDVIRALLNIARLDFMLPDLSKLANRHKK